MTIINAKTSEATYFMVDSVGNEFEVHHPVGAEFHYPSTVKFESLDIGDSWSAGEVTIQIVDDGVLIFRETSVYHNYFFGMEWGLPLAVTFIMIWAVKRGLRPSLENI